MSEPFKCRWGILGCGGIAKVFAKDLLTEPAVRGASDIQHTIQALGTSNSEERARKFAEACGIPSSATTYGNYQGLVADPNVDVIYVATPHSHHFQHCLLALRAGKHVVCEKPFTVNAPQLRILIEIAKERSLFLMEAVWTRFFPLSIEVRDLVKSGRIGEVRRVHAELDLCEDPDRRYSDGKHRMVNPDLAGGALLDLGLYPLTWVYQVLYHTLPDEDKVSPVVTGTISRFELTGVDAENVVVCTWPKSIGIATSGLRVATDPDQSGRTAITIKGTKGEIQVAHPAYRPQKITIIPGGKGSETVEKDFTITQGHGMHWQADAAARCIRDGKKECETIPLRESLLVMECMDKIREINGFQYPESIEHTMH